MPFRWQMVDEIAEVVRSAVAAGGREIARGLIAPGQVEGVLGDRQQFDVGEAHVLHIGCQPMGQFAVVEELRPPASRCQDPRWTS